MPTGPVRWQPWPHSRVKSLGQASFGKFLLIAAAIGFAAYGAYCFVLARCARM